ncbi:carbohydrate-binding protein, partial [Nonomuraea lactucae]|uniref:carbohydrate-binding protein n=1 Tax=Nonomuraea lactucae TaxID=2249762 RepID=UPI003084688F
MLGLRILASVASLAAAGVIAVVLPTSSATAESCAGPWSSTSSATAESCAGPWSSSAVYTGGASVSHNGHNWSAKWWTQGDTPGSADVWADKGACGGTSTPPPSGGCAYPNWAAGTWYAAGSIVKYTDGNYYRAEHDNPGYDPVISTWYWEPYTCGSPTTPPTDPPASGFVVSQAQFDQMFPSRNPFYTYNGLTAALSAYPGFA